MARVAIPNPDVKFLNMDGTVAKPWFDFLRSVDGLKLVDLRDVPKNATLSDGQLLAYSASAGAFLFEPSSAPTNGQVLVWDNTNKVWSPGAN